MKAAGNYQKVASEYREERKRRRAVIDALKKQRAENKKRITQKSAKRLPRIIADRESGLTLNEIAEKHGLTPQRISQILRSKSAAILLGHLQ